MTKGKKIGIAIFVALALCGGGYGGYTYFNNQKIEQEKQSIETVTVSRSDIEAKVSATGSIRPENSVEISSKITARLKEVLVKENDHVAAGQTLVTLDAKDFQTKRDQAQFKVTNTQAKYERALYLHDVGAYSDEQLENATFDYDSAVSSLAAAENDLNETSIVSPLDGVVLGEPKTVGTMAVAGSDNPTVIMRIADLSTKEIQAKIDETDIGSIRVGQKATFTVDSYTNKKFEAVVSKISQTDTGNTWDASKSSSSTSTNSVIYYYVTLDVSDPENLLFPAMTARVDIHTSNKSGVLTIPISTLRTDASGTYVMVKNDDGSQEKKYVEVGIYGTDNVEIVSGLTDGEEVVASSTSSDKKDKKSGHGPRM